MRMQCFFSGIREIGGCFSSLCISMFLLTYELDLNSCMTHDARNSSGSKKFAFRAWSCNMCSSILRTAVCFIQVMGSGAHMAILLRESDVEKLATMDMAIEAVEQAFRLQGEQKADTAPRRRCRVDHGMLHVMSASLPTSGVCRT